jgi:hypothetical protein
MQLSAPSHKYCYCGNCRDPLLTSINATLTDPVYVSTTSHKENAHQTTVIMAADLATSITNITHTESHFRYTKNVILITYSTIKGTMLRHQLMACGNEDKQL